MHHDLKISTLLFTIFLDALGIGIAMPLFTPLVLNTNYLFSSNPAAINTTFILNSIFALYPLGMFIGSPIIGFLADKYGKKIILLNCILGNLIGAIICILGILKANLWLIFLGRLISGLTAGNIPTAQAAIISLTDTQALKATRLGYISMVYGLGFTVGPIITVFLPAKITLFNYSIPIVIFAICLIVNFFLIKALYQDKVKETAKTLKLKVNYIKEFAFVKEISLYLVLLCILLIGQFTFFQDLPLLLDKYFDYLPRTISATMAYYAMIFSITLVHLFPQAVKKFSIEFLLKISFYALTFSVLLFSFNKSHPLVWLYLLPIPCMLGFGYVALITLISTKTDPTKQGAAMGIANSIAAFAWATTPLTNALFISKNILLPDITASILFAIGSMILLFIS
jgi:MFS family permease